MTAGTAETCSAKGPGPSDDQTRRHFQYRCCNNCDGRALPVIETEWDTTVCGNCRNGDFLAGPLMNKQQADDFNITHQPADTAGSSRGSSYTSYAYDSSYMYGSSYDSESEAMSDYDLEFIDGPASLSQIAKEDTVSCPLQQQLLLASEAWSIPFPLPFPTLTKPQSSYIDMDDFLLQKETSVAGRMFIHYVPDEDTDLGDFRKVLRTGRYASLHSLPDGWTRDEGEPLLNAMIAGSVSEETWNRLTQRQEPMTRIGRTDGDPVTQAIANTYVVAEGSDPFRPALDLDAAYRMRKYMAEHCESYEPLPLEHIEGQPRPRVVRYGCYKEESPKGARNAFATDLSLDAFDKLDTISDQIYWHACCNNKLVCNKAGWICIRKFLRHFRGRSFIHHDGDSKRPIGSEHLENLTFELLMYVFHTQRYYRFEVLGVVNGRMDYLIENHMFKNPKWADPHYWQTSYCYTKTVPFAFRAAMNHMLPIDPDRAFRTVTLDDLKLYGLQSLCVMVDKRAFHRGQWGKLLPGSCREDKDHSPTGHPAARRFYPMTHRPTGRYPVEGAKKEIFDSSPKDEATARIIRDKIMVFLDIEFIDNKPLYLTGGGIFIFEHPIQWYFIQRAEMLEDGTLVYDRAYQDAKMDTAGRSFALSYASAPKPYIEYYDQVTGEVKRTDKWVGKPGVLCLNEHPCRQGIMSCPLCGVRFKYEGCPNSGATPARDVPKHLELPHAWSSFEEARDWGQDKEACDYYGVNPPPDTVQPSGAASSGEAWPHEPSRESQSSTDRQNQTWNYNSYYAEQRRWHRDHGTTLEFSMDTHGQQKMAKQKEKHAENWNKPGMLWDNWRVDRASEGKSKDQTSMLSHRPWTCWSSEDTPPRCDSVVLNDFKTMAFRFMSHAEWRQHNYAEQEPPKPKEWLLPYWGTYLDHCTKNDRNSRSYGPLWNYLRFEAKAIECFEKFAGYPSPNHRVKDWQEWEDLMRSEGEPVFWNPQELLED